MTAVPQSPAAAEVARFEVRKLALVRAAYELIAHEGFENLRTRAVADRVGCNVATLHHYFPTKEALIGGVALYLAAQFETLRAPAAPPASARERLVQEFADTAFYMSEKPDMIEVLRELSARARRDPAVASVVEPLKGHWRASLEQMIADGVAKGEFDPGMSVREAAGVLIALFWGAATLPLRPDELARARRAVERWLAPEPSTNPRRRR
jgi:AcrR family transcriptional regulator